MIKFHRKMTNLIISIWYDFLVDIFNLSFTEITSSYWYENCIPSSFKHLYNSKNISGWRGFSKWREGIWTRWEFFEKGKLFFIDTWSVHFSEFVLSTQFYSLPRRAGLGCSASLVMTEKNYYAEKNGLFPRKRFLELSAWGIF